MRICKRVLILAVAGLAFAGCGYPKWQNDLKRQMYAENTAGPVVDVPPAGRYKVVRVIDGDTLDIGVRLVSGELLKQRIRLRGIDTPERGEKGYQEAADELKRLAGDWVVISYSSSPRKRGRYGRLLCYLQSAKSDDISLALLKGGYARLYRKMGHDREAVYWQAAGEDQRPKGRR